MFIPLSAKQAVNHGFYFVKGKIVYIWCSDMVGKVTLTKMELIIYGIDNKVNLGKQFKLGKVTLTKMELKIYGIDNEVKFDKERKNSKV